MSKLTKCKRIVKEKKIMGQQLYASEVIINICLVVWTTYRWSRLGKTQPFAIHHFVLQ